MKKGKAISVLLLILIPLAVLLMLPIHATTITSIDPTSGPPSTVVRLIGEIYTLGGTYQIWFDIDDDGDPFETGELMVEDKTAADSYSVNDTFIVPSCVGSDAGNDHLVGLKDATTMAYKTTPFYVKTERSISAPRKQEGVDVPINVTVTGGVNSTFYNYTVAVTDPAGSTYKHYNFSFKSDANGGGSVTRNYGTTFSTGAHTNYTGTYNMAANETAPGTITNAATRSFTIGLTNATEYRRFETVNIRTAGWTPGQYVYANITDPAGTVVFSSGNVSLTSGADDWDWEVPWNAAMGTYTAEVVNATGSDKTVHSIQTFTVKSASLTVDITDEPATSTSYQRTETVSIKFTIEYPNGTYYNNVTHFSSITVSVYYNTTLVTSIPLTAADYEAAYKWKVSWKIPRDAVLGTGYNFTIAKESIVDVIDNKGPDPGVSSNSFTVQYAELTVKVTDQPADNYTRTETATAKINVTYPDSTFFTDADLGSIYVKVMRDGTNIANVTLAAGDFSSATNKWTVGWVIPWNATESLWDGEGYTPDYWFRVESNAAIDASGNKGPAEPVVTDTFDVFKCTLDIASVSTDKTSYRRGDYVIVSFDAYYLDGSPVVIGNCTDGVILTAPDGYTTVKLSPVPVGGGRWKVRWWLSEAEQLGDWTVTLGADKASDFDATDNKNPNTGPAADLTTTFEVLEAEVTLADVLAEIEALKTAISDLEADLAALSATAATTSDVDAVSSDVDAVKTAVAALDTAISDLDAAISGLESDLAALSATAATTSDVDAVSSDVDALKTAVAALDTAISGLESAIDAVKTDLSGAVGGVNTYAMLAMVLALIAAIAAIASVILIYTKVAG